MSLHQRPHQKPLAVDSLHVSTATAPSRPLPLVMLPYLFSLLALLLLLFLTLLFPWAPTSPPPPASSWRAYTLQEAVAFAVAADNNTIVLFTVSGAYLPFLSNWFMSARHVDRTSSISTPMSHTLLEKETVREKGEIDKHNTQISNPWLGGG